MAYEPVQRALAARMPAAPQREVSATLGRGVHRLARRLAPDHPAVTALAGLSPARCARWRSARSAP